MRLWPHRRRDEPAEEQPAPEPAPRTAPPRQPASAFSRPYAPGEESAPTLPATPPGSLSLTLEEAKAAIRAAGGDVMQVGFLARAYQRERDEEPQGRETAAARRRLCELVAKRLRDRGLLEAEGRFELVEEPPAVWSDGQ
ncbi:MAG: hypothetical protein ACRDNI_01775 [Gaiellaceae bacterium]